MKTPHKNVPHVHAELIKAWADGAEIEFMKKDGVWQPHQDAWPWFNEWTYRIKPESKPDVVKELFVEADEVHFHLLNKNLKLTFDGETGKLKSAEVL